MIESDKTKSRMYLCLVGYSWVYVRVEGRIVYLCVQKYLMEWQEYRKQKTYTKTNKENTTNKKYEISTIRMNEKQCCCMCQEIYRERENKRLFLPTNKWRVLLYNADDNNKRNKELFIVLELHQRESARARVRSSKEEFHSKPWVSVIHVGMR